MTTESVDVPLCPQVKTTDYGVFLVRMDNKETKNGTETGELCCFDDREQASHAVDTLANEEIRVMLAKANGKIKVFRENAVDPSPYCSRVDISVQKLGTLYDGPVQKVASVGFVHVPYATFSDPLLSRGRATLDYVVEEGVPAYSGYDV